MQVVTSERKLREEDQVRAGFFRIGNEPEMILQVLFDIAQFWGSLGEGKLDFHAVIVTERGVVLAVMAASAQWLRLSKWNR